nr:hypothetical protein [Tanacetum cinerariifolium]
EDDVCEEADFNNLETSITVSPIPTTRVHKDHHVTREAKCKSHVESLAGYRNLSAKFKYFSANSINEDNAVGTLVLAVGKISPNNTNTFSVVGPSNAAAKLEAITYFDDEDDVGAEADFNNLQTSITQKKDGIFIHQDKYVVEILMKFGLLDGKSASTPIDTEKPLLKHPDGEDVDVHTYRSMIGSLMYLTSSRPDIMFVVYACACFQVTLKASHLHAVKRIFRYLKGKPHLSL